MLKHSLVFVLLFGLSVSAQAAPDGDPELAQAILKEPVLALLEEVSPEADTEKSFEAFESGAYMTAFFLGADASVMPRQEEMWEEAQRDSDPGRAFLQHVLDEWHRVNGELKQTIGLVESRSQGVERRTLDPLLISTHMLVQAEINHDLAGRMLTGTGADDRYVQSAEQRYSLLRPLVLAEYATVLAQGILHEIPNRPGDTVVDLERLELLVEGAGGIPPDAFHLPGEGTIHRLVRHVMIYESGFKNMTPQHLEAALLNLSEARDRWDQSIPQGRAAVVTMDASWWLQESEQRYDPDGLWDPLIWTLYGYVRGVEYEAELLSSSINGGSEDEVEPREVPGLGGGLLVGIVAVVAICMYLPFLWRKRRVGLHGVTGIVALFFVVSIFAYVPVAEADQGDPSTGTTDFTNPKGAWGSLALDDEEIVRFVWSACETQGPGCRDIWAREHDPSTGDWTESVKLISSEKNLTFPLLVPGNSQDYLFWRQVVEEADTELHWCRLDDCRPMRLSSEGWHAEGNVRALLGPDGHLRVVWQEDTQERSRVVFQQYDGSTWGLPVLSPTESAGQYAPVLDVDSTGRTHLAWMEALSATDKNAVHATLYYGLVASDGASVSQVEHVPFPGMDQRSRVSLAVDDGDVVGLALTNLQDAFFMERSPGDDNWSDAVNITRTGMPGSPSEIQLLSPSVNEWSFIYRNGTVWDMQLWGVKRIDGFWLPPEKLVDDDAILNPVSQYGSSGGLHMAWTYTYDAGAPFWMHYHHIPAGDAGVDASGSAPVILNSTPEDGAWLRAGEIAFRMEFVTYAALDMDETRLLVGGEPVPLQVKVRSHEQVLEGTATGLEDGEHYLQLTVVDQVGRSVMKNWTIRMDSVAPQLELSWRIGDEVVDEVGGWYNESVAFQARAVDDGSGSPSRVMASFDDGVRYHPLLEIADSFGWTMEGDWWVLPENEWLEFRLRAQDEAGNVDVGPRIAVGVDKHPPEIEFDVPQWGREEFRVGVDVLNGNAAPVVVEIEVLDGDGVVVAQETSNGDDIVFNGLEDGMYSLRAETSDEAGNQGGAGHWSFGVDSIPPTVTYDAEHMEFAASDEGSGLATIQIRYEGRSLINLDDLAGTTSWEGTLEWPEDADHLRVLVQDVAGNAWRGNLDPLTGAVADPPEMDVTDEDGTLEGGVQETGASDAERQPTPSVGVVGVLAVTLVVACLRGLRGGGRGGQAAWP